jgi:voltage-gated potassium channel
MIEGKKERIYKILFEVNSRAGKLFDIFLISAIILSVIVVILDSVPDISGRYHGIFIVIEWIITILFTLEYLLRLFVVRKPYKYIFSFYGIIDLLATLPSYLGLILSGGSSLLVIRTLRLLRIFRVFKLSRYTSAGLIIRQSLAASKAKIGIFLVTVFTAVIIIGTLMYIIEGEKSGFTSIPRGVYWAIVTITTVGYGDIAPVTSIGQFIASITMLMGYAIIAVPTGIVSAEIVYQKMKTGETEPSYSTCRDCLEEEHDDDANYCKNCGLKLKNS